MKLITELTENVNYLFEENKDSGKKDYYIEGVFMQGDIKNRNGRMYPGQVLAKEANRYNKEYIQKNKAYGELGHPQGPTINLERVSHMIKELRPDGSNFIGKAKILDTPYGNIVKNLIDEGAQLGVSSRSSPPVFLSSQSAHSPPSARRLPALPGFSLSTAPS